LPRSGSGCGSARSEFSTGSNSCRSFASLPSGCQAKNKKPKTKSVISYQVSHREATVHDILTAACTRSWAYTSSNAPPELLDRDHLKNRIREASVRELDALIGHVQFDERDVETEHDLILRHWQSKEPAPAM
jgi:hypothetical protein